MTGGNSSNRNVSTAEETKIFRGFYEWNNIQSITNPQSPKFNLPSCCQGNDLFCFWLVPTSSSAFYQIHVMVHHLFHHLPTKLSWSILSKHFIKTNKSLFGKLSEDCRTFRWKSSYHQRLTGYYVRLKLDFPVFQCGQLLFFLHIVSIKLFADRKRDVWFAPSFPVHCVYVCVGQHHVNTRCLAVL